MSSVTIPLAEVAARLGHTVITIQAGLKQGRLPFGVAFQAKGDKWTYIVPRAAFETFMQLGGTAADHANRSKQRSPSRAG